MLMIGAIILLHSLVPHVHYEAVKDTAYLHTTSSNSNILKDIQISLGFNQGDGHFEHFVELDDDNTDLMFHALTSIHELRFADQGYRVFTVEGQQQTNHCTLRLRGPPIG